MEASFSVHSLYNYVLHFPGTKNKLWSLEVVIFFLCRCKCADPLDAGRKWRIHQMSRRYSSFFCKFNSLPVSRRDNIEKNFMCNQKKICAISLGQVSRNRSFANFTLRHGWPPANLLHIFTTPFLRNTSGWLPLGVWKTYLGPHRTSMTELFCKNIERILADNYFPRKLHHRCLIGSSIHHYIYWVIFVLSYWLGNVGNTSIVSAMYFSLVIFYFYSKELCKILSFFCVF